MLFSELALMVVDKKNCLPVITSEFYDASALTLPPSRVPPLRMFLDDCRLARNEVIASSRSPR